MPVALREWTSQAELVGAGLHTPLPGECCAGCPQEGLGQLPAPFEAPQKKPAGRRELAEIARQLHGPPKTGARLKAESGSVLDLFPSQRITCQVKEAGLVNMLVGRRRLQSEKKTATILKYNII